MSMVRSLLLAWTIGRRGKGRLLLLVMLLAIAINVFLVVQALSRASTQSLQSAVDTDSGVAGSYRASLSAGAGVVTASDLAEPLAQAAMDAGVVDFSLYDVYQGLDLDCPGSDNYRDWPVAVAVDRHGNPEPARLTEPVTSQQTCLGGLVLEQGSVGIATGRASRDWKETYFLDPRLSQLVRPLASTATVSLDLRDPHPERDLQLALEDRLRQLVTARPEWVLAEVTVNVQRLDTGDATRQASEAVRWLYLVISWAVLGVGGLGVLVAELLVLRDRSWFFGLSRATGAGRRHVATLVLGDVLLVFTAGMALAFVIAKLAQQPVEEFSRGRFGFEMSLLAPQVAGQLALAATAVLTLASVYPVWIALRLDPLDILEGR